jgi:hypothetical protein
MSQFSKKTFVWNMDKKEYQFEIDLQKTRKIYLHIPQPKEKTGPGQFLDWAFRQCLVYINDLLFCDRLPIAYFDQMFQTFITTELFVPLDFFGTPQKGLENFADVKLKIVTKPLPVLDISFLILEDCSP